MIGVDVYFKEVKKYISKQDFEQYIGLFITVI